MIVALQYGRRAARRRLPSRHLLQAPRHQHVLHTRGVGLREPGLLESPDAQHSGAVGPQHARQLADRLLPALGRREVVQ